MTSPAPAPRAHPQRLFVLAAVMAALAFAGAIFITDPPGPGLDDDSSDYLGSATSLAHGTGLVTPSAWWDSPETTSPLGHFPPGYPATLAAGIRLGLRPVVSARLVQALAAAASVAGLVVLAGSTSLIAGALAGAIFIVTPDILLAHARVLSEPLFLALFILTLMALVLRPDRPLLIGLAAAAASLVRYAGLGIVGAAGLLALCAGGGNLRARARRVALVMGPAFVLQLAWALHVKHLGAHVRDIGWEGSLAPVIPEGWHTLRDWLAPGLADHAAGLAAIVALIGLAGFGLLARAASRAPDTGGSRAEIPRRIVVVSGVVAASYVAFLCVARLIADPWIPFDERLLAPLFVLAGLVAPVGLALGWRGWRVPARVAAVLLLAGWAAASAVQSRDYADDLRTDGWGYAGDDFLTWQTVHWLLTPAARVPIFSNDPAAVWFVTGRPSRFLPAVADKDSDLAAFVDTLRVRHGLVVGFTTGDSAIADPARLAQKLHLAPVARFDDGAVWAPPPAPTLAAPRHAP